MTREEAIKVAYGIPVTKAQHEALQFLIPELAESEDERIRRGLIEALKTSKTVGELKFILPEPTIKEAIAYLEKQKEQNQESIEVLKSMRPQKKEDLPPGFYFIDQDGNKYYSKEFRYGDMKIKVTDDIAKAISKKKEDEK